MCGVAGILVRLYFLVPQKPNALLTLPQLGDTKATTAAVDLHESCYYLQHVCQPQDIIRQC